MEFVRVTRQGAMRSLDYWFTPRRRDEWRPSNVLWSQPARALPNIAGAPVRSEHVYPLNLLSRDLLAAKPTVEAFGRIVAERLILAVITVEEDERLSPFDRYRAAGVDVEHFAPRQAASEGSRLEVPRAGEHVPVTGVSGNSHG